MTDGYRLWEKEVDRELVRICGFGIDDLPDMAYRAYYDSETLPEEAAAEVLRIMREEAPW